MYPFIKHSYALQFLCFNFVNTKEITSGKNWKNNMGQLQN